MQHDFPKDRRLRKSWEYQQVWKMGCKRHTPHFILLIAETRTGVSRLGLTVSRKVGNAVQRNRVKRLLREYFRTENHRFRQPIDLSVVAKKGAAELTTRQLAAELDRVLSKTGLAND